MRQHTLLSGNAIQVEWLGLDHRNLCPGLQYDLNPGYRYHEDDEISVLRSAQEIDRLCISLKVE